MTTYGTYGTYGTKMRIEDLKVGDFIFYQRDEGDKYNTYIQVHSIRDGVPRALGGYFGTFPIEQRRIRANWGF